MKETQIVQAALDAGFMLSTAHGQAVGKLMPTSDYETLKAFADKVRAPSADTSPDKARVAEERRHIESTLEDIGPFLENLRCAVMAHATRTDLTERIDRALKAVHTALAKGGA